MTRYRTCVIRTCGERWAIAAVLSEQDCETLYAVMPGCRCRFIYTVGAVICSAGGLRRKRSAPEYGALLQRTYWENCVVISSSYSFDNSIESCRVFSNRLFLKSRTQRMPLTKTLICFFLRINNQIYYK